MYNVETEQNQAKYVLYERQLYNSLHSMSAVVRRSSENNPASVDDPVWYMMYKVEQPML